MKLIKKRSITCRAIILCLVLACLLLLTACQSLPVLVNDPAGECDHPPKPKPPYYDLDVALYLIDQGKAISTCMALLGR